KWRTKLDAFGLFRHGFDKFGVDLLFDQDAAAGRADFALIDEDAEQGPVHCGFPVGIGKENVGRFATEFERYALEGVGGGLDDDLADGGAAGESNFVDSGMRNERSPRGFAKT